MHEVSRRMLVSAVISLISQSVKSLCPASGPCGEMAGEPLRELRSGLDRPQINYCA